MRARRSYKMSVIWRGIDNCKRHEFDDKTQSYFMPNIKIERWFREDGTEEYEMYYTTVPLYRVANDEHVNYAYAHGLKALSDSLSYTFAMNRVDRLLKRDEQPSSELIDKVNLYANKPNTIKLNFYD